MSPTRRTVTGAVAVALAATALAAAPAADAKPAPRAYKNCTALNKAYPHGVGRSGARDHVSGRSKPVTNFVVDTRTYNLNTKRDRDKDGVACEKR